MSNLDQHQLREKIDNGEITAIALDTSTYQRLGFKFDRGLLALCDQFPKAGVTFLITDITYRELCSHYVAVIQECLSSADSALRKAVENKACREDILAAFLNQAANAEMIAKAAVDGFLKGINATQICESTLCTLDEVLKRYFLCKPPFENTKTKKNEFPDAFALNALENWAQSHKVELLAISEDKGWDTYAAASNLVHSTQGLVGALSALQARSDNVLKSIEAYLRAKPAEFSKELQKELNNLGYSAEAQAHHYIEVEVEGVEVVDVETEHIDSRNLHQVAYEGNKITIETTIAATIEAHGSAEISVYDSVDKEHFQLGIESVSTRDEIELEAVISFFVENQPDNMSIELAGIELTQSDIAIDFGYIEPDFGGD
jgi:hypothetical protein